MPAFAQPRAGLAPALLCALLAPLPASAQDFIGAFGATHSDNPRATTYAWLLSYSHDLTPVLSASFTALNEGHVPGHHRDGHSAQLWARAKPAESLTLAAGFGPYRFYDTTVAQNRDHFANAHGWGTVASAAASWRAPGSRWLYQVRVDRVIANTAFDTTQFLAGVGYRFDQDGSFASNAVAREVAVRRNELVLMSGRTVINSFESESARAMSAEYRHAFGPVVRGSIGWLNEGDARLARRNGIVAEGWLEPSFYRDRFTLGIGAGGYFAIDPDSPRGRGALVILGTTFSYHFAHGVIGRITWHRVSSNYDRDSDIFLAGLGYRF